MDKFDEKVIGYDSIKETLRQIADVLKRPEAYKEKGVSMPRGLLMESAPGLGKSLMASISLCRNPLHSAAEKSDFLRCHIRPEIPARQEHRLHPTAGD